MGYAKARNYSGSNHSFVSEGRSPLEASQLKFYLDESAQKPTLRMAQSSVENRYQNRYLSRPVGNEVRRSLDEQALLDHVNSNRDFWIGVAQQFANSQLRNVGSEPFNLPIFSFSPENALVGIFLESLVTKVKHSARKMAPEVSATVISGLNYLNAQIRSREMDHRGFRTVWLLLWPVLSDFELLTEHTKEIRIELQRLISKSF